MSTCEVCSGELRRPLRGPMPTVCSASCRRIRNRRNQGQGPSRFTPEQLRARRAASAERKAS